MTARPPRSGPRPRYGRISTLSAAVVVTVVSVLAGSGVLPGGAAPSAAEPSAGHGGGQAAVLASGSGPTAPPSTTPTTRDTPAGGPVRDGFLPGGEASVSDLAVPVPADSGSGRRVVYDIGDQRVWLVESDGTVARSYLVSGSLYDNLDPGTYEVYSRSRDAIGIDDSGTMRYMVRFAHGERAAIGFHDIPVSDGRRLQTREQLGTPQSHGCIRQARPDARALWEFAPLGTQVVVTA